MESLPFLVFESLLDGDFDIESIISLAHICTFTFVL